MGVSLALAPACLLRATCSLEYPELTISSIARTAAAALTTSALAVLKGYRKKGDALITVKSLSTYSASFFACK